MGSAVASAVASRAGSSGESRAPPPGATAKRHRERKCSGGRGTPRAPPRGLRGEGARRTGRGVVLLSRRACRRTARGPPRHGSSERTKGMRTARPPPPTTVEKESASLPAPPGGFVPRRVDRTPPVDLDRLRRVANERARRCGHPRATTPRRGGSSEGRARVRGLGRR